MNKANGLKLGETHRSVMVMLLSGHSLVKTEVAHGMGRKHKGRWAADVRNEAISILTQERP